MSRAAELRVRWEPRHARWLPLLKPVLLVPHLLALLMLYAGSTIAWVGSAASVVAGGVYPVVFFDYVLGVLRWTTRVTAYALNLTEQYPPFSLLDAVDDDVRVRVEYPRGAGVARWRPLVSWALVLPHAVVLIVLYAGLLAVGLLSTLAILVTGRHPTPLFGLATRVLAYTCAVGAYAWFLTDRYPALRP